MDKIEINNRIKKLTDKNVDELQKLYEEVLENSKEELEKLAIDN